MVWHRDWWWYWHWHWQVEDGRRQINRSISHSAGSIASLLSYWVEVIFLWFIYIGMLASRALITALHALQAVILIYHPQTVHRVVCPNSVQFMHRLSKITASSVSRMRQISWEDPFTCLIFQQKVMGITLHGITLAQAFFNVWLLGACHPLGSGCVCVNVCVFEGVLKG